jgi:uroporphyrinogen-III synthase
MNARRLEGLGVVVTRPRSAGEPLATALASEGAKTWLFPALAIEDVEPAPQLKALLSGISRFDMAIFVSANAVEKGLAMARRFAPWPASIQVAAIGEATAQALRNSGVAGVISPPERHDSEGLLQLPQLRDVRGRNIIVFRGEGGRERLKETLEERGAAVTYAECYRRVRPDADPSAVVAALSRGEVHAVSVLSGETLGNFVTMIGAGAERLASVALVVPHAAVGARPEARRFARIVVAEHGSEGLIEALTRIRATT